MDRVKHKQIIDNILKGDTKNEISILLKSVYVDNKELYDTYEDDIERGI